ncbi:hypothetical protein DUNSADRAFT_14871 [Dunaliella salina]|uniref:Uncharacterized protein n=1 Tax=Dunaliella salina TaxID=3046 RepID=A0ABQ7G6K6_DUNSA|nr:hypothetical protein DUNSADRAFT_14871 [Dunaliella salina]|eukprot:KAF5830229.1 hypothetical protein DUNSADRAFT_14871 [Dunaliella salina]
MRQYFMDGFYQQGEKNPDHAFEPSGSLLRALLIAGASTMTGYAARNAEKLALYDVNQGYGRVYLSRSLPLKGVSDSIWRLWVRDHKRVPQLSFYSDGQSPFIDRFSATGTGPIIVAMSYNDYPGVPGGKTELVNDLDLKVIHHSSGTMYWGNEREGGDRRNNDDKIVLSNPSTDGF